MKCRHALSTMLPLLAAVVFLSAAGHAAAPASASKGADRLGWHTVAEGETIGGIARWLGVDPAALLRLNPTVRPNELKPGDRIRVPCGTARHMDHAPVAGRGHVPALPDEVRANVPDDAVDPKVASRPVAAQPVGAKRPQGCPKS